MDTAISALQEGENSRTSEDSGIAMMNNDKDNVGSGSISPGSEPSKCENYFNDDSRDSKTAGISSGSEALINENSFSDDNSRDSFTQQLLREEKQAEKENEIEETEMKKAASLKDQEEENLQEIRLENI